MASIQIPIKPFMPLTQLISDSTQRVRVNSESAYKHAKARD
ncbi:uncharacterized protein RSE6_11193 [Rhynchosporium secalis]|uniref:Uncharacterized protein n=1 Tax=Rhynchosporium secalis TaxID=38038 RepID=A0A1E1MMD0_RHYSE|nr:uncharacterized protein RSE6_11193 [Rhynchosporium secalis]